MVSLNTQEVPRMFVAMGVVVIAATKNSYIPSLVWLV